MLKQICFILVNISSNIIYIIGIITFTFGFMAFNELVYKDTYILLLMTNKTYA